MKKYFYLNQMITILENSGEESLSFFLGFNDLKTKTISNIEPKLSMENIYNHMIIKKNYNNTKTKIYDIFLFINDIPDKSLLRFRLYVDPLKEPLLFMIDDLKESKYFSGINELILPEFESFLSRVLREMKIENIAYQCNNLTDRQYIHKLAVEINCITCGKKEFCYYYDNKDINLRFEPMYLLRNSISEPYQIIWRIQISSEKLKNGGEIYCPSVLFNQKEFEIIGIYSKTYRLGKGINTKFLIETDQHKVINQIALCDLI